MKRKLQAVAHRMLEKESGSAIVPTPLARELFEKIRKERQCFRISLEQQIELEKEIKGLLEKIVAFDSRIASCAENSKAAKIHKLLSKAAENLSKSRWEIEEGRLRDFPEDREK